VVSHRRTALLVVALLAAPAAAAEPGEKYAVLIGVRACPEAKALRTLPHSDDDVTDLAKVLQLNGFKKDNVIVLAETHGKEEGRFLPRKENIRKELRQLLQGLRTADTVVVAFSGHGVQLKGDKETYLCPADAKLDDKATLLALKDLYKEMEGCKAGVRLLVVDASRNDPLAEKRSAKDVGLEGETRPEVAEPPIGVAAFFACSAKEKSFEADKLDHGVFFHYLIEGLRGEAAGEDGNVSLQGLGDYVRRRVKDLVRVEHNASQRPELLGKNLDKISLAKLRLAGKWTGEYSYPEDAQAPVKFHLKLAQRGDQMVGSTKEPNTFGDASEPFLYATCKGKIDLETGKVSWTKTYDGTGGQSHSIEYTGTLSADGTKIEGEWDLQGTRGKFTLKKLPPVD
jgi:uncharacterized caspase-like protein